MSDFPIVPRLLPEIKVLPAIEKKPTIPLSEDCIVNENPSDPIIPDRSQTQANINSNNN